MVKSPSPPPPPGPPPPPRLPPPPSLVSSSFKSLLESQLNKRGSLHQKLDKDEEDCTIPHASSSASSYSAAVANHRSLHWDSLTSKQLSSTPGPNVWSGPIADSPWLLGSSNIYSPDQLEAFTKLQGHSNLSFLHRMQPTEGKQPAHLLLDTSSSQNILIRFKNLPLQALKDSLHNMDTTKLSYTQVLQCIGALAKTQAVDAVTSWCSQEGNDPALLGPAESYLHVLCTVPDCRTRLDAMRMFFFHAEDLSKKISDLKKITQSFFTLKKCTGWTRLLHHCLASGNAINSRRPGYKQAPGFRISSLCKFSDIKSSDKAWCLLDAVVEAIEIDAFGPRHLDDVASAYASLSIAKEVDLRVASNELNEFEKQMMKLSSLDPSPSSPQLLPLFPPGSALNKKWAAHYTRWSKSLTELKQEYETALQSVRDCATYHGEPMPGGSPTWEHSNSKSLFDTLFRFVVSVRDSTRKVRAAHQKHEANAVSLSKQFSCPVGPSRTAAPASPDHLPPHHHCLSSPQQPSWAKIKPSCLSPRPNLTKCPSSSPSSWSSGSLHNSPDVGQRRQDDVCYWSNLAAESTSPDHQDVREGSSVLLSGKSSVRQMSSTPELTPGGSEVQADNKEEEEREEDLVSLPSPPVDLYREQQGPVSRTYTSQDPFRGPFSRLPSAPLSSFSLSSASSSPFVPQGRSQSTSYSPGIPTSYTSPSHTPDSPSCPSEDTRVIWVDYLQTLNPQPLLLHDNSTPTRNPPSTNYGHRILTNVLSELALINDHDSTRTILLVMDLEAIEAASSLIPQLGEVISVLPSACLVISSRKSHLSVFNRLKVLQSVNGLPSPDVLITSSGTCIWARQQDEGSTANKWMQWMDWEPHFASNGGRVVMAHSLPRRCAEWNDLSQSCFRQARERLLNASMALPPKSGRITTLRPEDSSSPFTPYNPQGSYAHTTTLTPVANKLLVPSTRQLNVSYSQTPSVLPYRPKMLRDSNSPSEGHHPIGAIEKGSSTGSLWQVGVRVKGKLLAQMFVKALLERVSHTFPSDKSSGSSSSGDQVAIICTRIESPIVTEEPRGLWRESNDLLQTQDQAEAEEISPSRHWTGDNEESWAVDCVPASAAPSAAVAYCLSHLLGLTASEVRVVVGAAPRVLA